MAPDGHISRSPKKPVTTSPGGGRRDGDVGARARFCLTMSGGLQTAALRTTAVCKPPLLQGPASGGASPKSFESTLVSVESVANANEPRRYTSGPVSPLRFQQQFSSDLVHELWRWSSKINRDDAFRRLGFLQSLELTFQ